jgi:hypothetical protein
MAGALVVCLGLAVLIVAVVALREPKGHVTAQRSASNVGKQSSAAPQSTRPKSTKGASSSSAQSSPSPNGDSHSSTREKSVPLIVLNNTTIGGLAQRAAQRFESGGWRVTTWGNYQNNILSTCAYYDPSVAGAQAAAEALQQQYPAIKRVKPKFAELPGGPVVVVLTPDYSEG